MAAMRRRHRAAAPAATDEPHRYRSAHRAREEQWSRTLRASLVAAGALHLAVFALWPQVSVERDYIDLTQMTQRIALAPLTELEVPESRPDAPRPRVPRTEAEPLEQRVDAPELELEIDEWLREQDLIPDFYEQTAFEIPPPVIRDETPDLSRFVRYSRNMSRPRISNMSEVDDFLRDRYQPLAEATGLRGEVLVYFWIDERGGVEKALIYNTSGSLDLDHLAVQLTDIVRFSPARHSGKPVAVRVMMPIVFRAT